MDRNSVFLGKYKISVAETNPRSLRYISSSRQRFIDPPELLFTKLFSCLPFSSPVPPFLLVTWSAKRRALVAAITGCLQSRSESLVPFDQRSENESSGSNRHRCRCAVNRITRIRLFPLFFHTGCSQSSRFPTAGQRERSSGNEIGMFVDHGPSGNACVVFARISAHAQKLILRGG